MELFVINRYDETKKDEIKDDHESRMLERLRKNIEIKQKNKRRTLEQPAASIDIEIPVETQKKKKRKKDEVPTEPETVNKDSTVCLENQEMLSESVEATVPPEEEFQVLGDQIFEDLEQVSMVLPHWLAHPEILSNDLSEKGSSVTDVAYLSEIMKKNLKSMNIKNLFPVQEKVIPWIINVQSKPLPFRPQDVCVSAPTGSGKTLSYAIPIVEHLLATRVECKVRALIMLPVYELAVQVFQVIDKLCNNVRVRCILLSKNRPLEHEQNLLMDYDKGTKKYSSKVDIIVTTGGRLVEHLFYTKGFNLKSLKFLVIDEADNAMAQMNNDWYHHFIHHLGIQNELQSNRLSYRDLLALVDENGEYKIPQKLLFSATLSQDPEKINVFNLFQPRLFTTAESSKEILISEKKRLEMLKEDSKRGNFLGKYTTPAELTEQYCITEYKLKPLTLFGLIMQNNWKRFLCFTNTIESSHRLSFVLQTLCGQQLVIEELSSILPIRMRQKVLQRFHAGKVNGLICSDALARGIDVPNIEVVISYDLPKHLKIYIHRVGRTARAGHPGTAVTMIAPDQIKTFEKLITTANKSNVNEIKGNAEIEESNALNYANALKNLSKALVLEAKSQKNKGKSGLSLFDKLQNQVKTPELPFDILPESWKPENQEIASSVEEKVESAKTVTKTVGKVENEKPKKNKAKKLKTKIV